MISVPNWWKISSAEAIKEDRLSIASKLQISDRWGKDITEDVVEGNWQDDNARLLLQVIHTPLCVTLGVESFVAPAPGPPCAREMSSVTVDPKLEALGVDVFAKSLHSRGKRNRVSGNGPV